jgi:hypothetical protein
MGPAGSSGVSEADSDVALNAMAARSDEENSLPQNWTLKGAISAGIVGAVVGLVGGMVAHPATAWFAVLEVGVPELPPVSRTGGLW